MLNNHDVTLGIDPGTARLGYGAIRGDDEPGLVEFGVFTTHSTDQMASRLFQLHCQLSELLTRCRPAALAVEQLFFARNVTNALSVGQARGVVLLAAAQHGVPVFEYKPNEVKLAVGGYGGADKKQMQEMVRINLGLSTVPEPDDAADALAVALCHVYSSRLGRLADLHEQ
jgi:crossover junction endodeoxyribonuclease RuvC